MENTTEMFQARIRDLEKRNHEWYELWEQTDARAEEWMDKYAECAASPWNHNLDEAPLLERVLVIAAYEDDVWADVWYRDAHGEWVAGRKHQPSKPIVWAAVNIPAFPGPEERVPEEPAP